MAKKYRFKLWKLCIMLGILIGIAFKLQDFIRTKLFRCGILEIRICNWSDYLMEMPIWIIITAILFFIIAYGIKYLLKFIVNSIKNFKLPKKEKEEHHKKKKEEKRSKKELKEEDEEEIEEPEEVIKI